MNIPKKIAEFRWYYGPAQRSRNLGATIRNLALHLKVHEDVIRAIMDSDEYLAEVENLIHTTQSPDERKKWIKDWRSNHGDDMYRVFGKRMGLSEEKAKEVFTRAGSQQN